MEQELISGTIAAVVFQNQENGYADRDDYLTCLSEDYGVSIEDVYSLAEMLGENEDFDGLVCVLEDAECLL